MSDTLALGRLIRESRLKKGMSLGQLAAAVGRSSSSVRRWERGEVPPASGIIDDLAGALDLDPDELRKLRPSPVTAVAQASVPPTEDRTDPKKPPTLEQPIVQSSPVGPDAVAQAPHRNGTGEARADRGFLGDVLAVLGDTFKDWHGWIRGVLTFVGLVVMVFVLAWATSELFSALGEVWDSFGVGG